MKLNRKFILCWAVCALFTGNVTAQTAVKLESSALRLEWKPSGKGLALSALSIKRNGGWQQLPHAGGEYTLLYAAGKPDKQPQSVLNPQESPSGFLKVSISTSFRSGRN